MTNNLPLIYHKINAIKVQNAEEFDSLFYEICSLIDKNLESGYLWISFYSYYNLFYNILVYLNQDEKVFDKYFFILSRIEEIVSRIRFNKEESIEMLLNNPFNKIDFLLKLKDRLDEDHYSLIKSRLDSINAILPKFDYESLLSLYSSMSLHNFLKLVKILSNNSNEIKKEEIMEMILVKAYNSTMKNITETISDIIDFGIKSKGDKFIQDFIEELLIKLVIHLHKNSEMFMDWRKTFLISTYENISRYFRLVRNYPLSIAIYLLASVENWQEKNYGYCANCLYKISRMVDDKRIVSFLINLAIDIASLEVSFEEEIKMWKREIEGYKFFMDCDEIGQNFDLLFGKLNIDDNLSELVRKKIVDFSYNVFSVLRAKKVSEFGLSMN
ncbi:MAG: hypothetical protein RMJ36_00190 [Candidatus Calescibacterium sp.]|nr:hypothetical protein [Candidatus Calescibacterium sp.]MDW8132064.1 hypothetical protein [Candidatus Calescibacterium sp.]